MRRPAGMIDCEGALRRLWALLDEELPAAERRDVHRHFQVCDRCFPQYDFQRAYRVYLRRVAESAPASGDLRDRIFRSLVVQEREGGR